MSKNPSEPHGEGSLNKYLVDIYSRDMRNMILVGAKLEHLAEKKQLPFNPDHLDVVLEALRDHAAFKSEMVCQLIAQIEAGRE